MEKSKAKSRKVVLSENILKLIIEGKVSLVKGKKLRYGKYRIVKRYVAKEQEGLGSKS